MPPKTMAVSKGQSYGNNRRSADPGRTNGGGHHPGVSLEDPLSKRVIVLALKEFLKRDDITRAEQDRALALELRLIQELRNG